MIFGEPPAFGKMMETLNALEQEINGQSGANKNWISNERT
jgi:hypothetical protein